MPAENVSGAYAHADEAVLRPDVGVEAQFSHRKPPKTYRYDSSLAPELAWDESGERPFAEWLLNLVAEAAEKGEAMVFAHNTPKEREATVREQLSSITTPKTSQMNENWLDAESARIFLQGYFDE